MDKDLASIQEARDLIKKAVASQKIYSQCDQVRMDEAVKHVALKIYENAEELAKLAVNETGFGNVKDKIVKNQFASMTLYEYIKDMKTHGIINIDEKNKIWEVGVAMGVIVGLIPSTNPTSTVIYKALISLKSGNAIIFSPHPAAINSITKATELIRGYLKEISLPEDLVSVLSMATMEATDALMKDNDVALILATGGKAMVKAAYSSGNPALGVGPGDVPAFIERSANIEQAVSMIIASKTFDNGVICASEQAIVVEEEIKDKVINEFKKQGCYFLDDKEKKALEKVMVNASGLLNPKIVGKTAFEIAKMAGVCIPSYIKVLIGFEEKVGKAYPFSMEKLSPILGFYVEENWIKACEKCIEILKYGGIGHSLSIHSENLDIIMEFALKKPAYRILVNTPSTHGGIGSSTGLAPSLTLGCGAVGGSSTSDNVTPLHLINIRRVAFGNKPWKLDEKAEDLDMSSLKLLIKEIIKEMSL